MGEDGSRQLRGSWEADPQYRKLADLSSAFLDPDGPMKSTLSMPASDLDCSVHRTGSLEDSTSVMFRRSTPCRPASGAMER